MKIYQRTTIQQIEVEAVPVPPDGGSEPEYLVRDIPNRLVIQRFDSRADLERWLSTWNSIRQV